VTSKKEEDHYSTLDVFEDASQEAIRAAYRRKAKENHPDRGGNSEKMSKINRAYETLSSAARRLNYDRTGQDRPPDTERFARDMIIGQINAWLSSDVNSGDLVKDITEVLDKEISQLHNNIAGIQKFCLKLQRRVNKLKFKGSGPDFVKIAIDTRIRETSQQAEQMRDKISQIQRAKEFLQNYDYEMELAIALETSPAT
jgi:curved DNA-binding protein CbpA